MASKYQNEFFRFLIPLKDFPSGVVMNMLSLSDACLYPLNSIIGPESVMAFGPVSSFRMIAFGYVKTWVSLSVVTNGKTRHAVPRVSRDPTPCSVPLSQCTEFGIVYIWTYLCGKRITFEPES
jgi:hypothetical protein